MILMATCFLSTLSNAKTTSPNEPYICNACTIATFPILDLIVYLSFRHSPK